MRMCWLLPPHRHLTAWLLRPVPPCPLASPSQVREAARRSVLSEMGLDSTPGKTLEFLRLKGCENAVIVAAPQWAGAVGGHSGWLGSGSGWVGTGCLCCCCGCLRSTYSHGCVPTTACLLPASLPSLLPCSG